MACREALPGYHAGTETPSLLRADALAMSLKAALVRAAVPLARAAAGFLRLQGWSDFGYARLADHARERFGRSGRWVRDMAALGRALDALPPLAAALTGEDGGLPLGRVAALLIGGIASAESVASWIALARRLPIRALRDAIRAARAAGSTSPVKQDDLCEHKEREDQGPLPGHDGEPHRRDEADDEDRTDLVRFLVPAPVAAAFDEGMDLYRAVVGSEATVTSFVEALVAEAQAGPDPPDLPDTQSAPLRRGLDAAFLERMYARTTDNWSHLPACEQASWALALAGMSLGRFHEIARHAGEGTKGDLDGQIRALIELENHLERRLGRLLSQMAEQGAWSRLRFHGVAHYAEQRLGMSRTTARQRVRTHRALRRYPVVARAYEEGTIGLEAAAHIARILGRDHAGPAVQRAWVLRARKATIKRLTDEARALVKRHGLPGEVILHASPGGDDAGDRRPLDGPPLPVDDATWQRGLRREPGTARGRLARFGQAAAGGHPADVFLRLRLPAAVAADLLAAVAAARRRVWGMVERVAWDRPWPDPHAPGSVMAARMFSIRCRRPPAWVGLLALLEDFVRIWDDPQAPPRRQADAVYIRDGWRCTAPGCTSRRNLEEHHIVYRSRGGDDELSNRTCLCRFHHQAGEHGGRVSCRGTAPLGIRWQLGRGGIGGAYRNELSSGGNR
ncbi:MAG: hypothetical protein ACE5HU_05640 [Acidobacteriota bacterium]